MKYFVLRVVLVVCFVGLFSFTSFAQFEFHPRLTLEEEYTDNLFLTNSNEQEDWITTIEPGISLTYDSRSVDVSVDYSLRYQFYRENDDENIDDFEDVQRADASAVFFSGRPFTLTVSESITRETLDEQERNLDDNDLVNRTTVYNTTISPEYRLELPSSFSLVFGYTYDRVDYVSNEGNDSEEHIGRFSLEKELSSNSIISLNYYYTVHQSDTDEDFDQQDYTVGLTQQVGPRLNLATEVGYSDVEYDNGRDEGDVIWMLTAGYQLSEALALNATYDQSFATSATDGLTKSRSAVLGLAYMKNLVTANAELYWEQTDYLLLNREDDAFGSRLDLTLPLSRAFSTTFDAAYERASYEGTPDEDVDRYSLGASLGYEYRRILASLGYRYHLSDSNITSNDYTNNVFILSATVRF